MSDKLFGVKRNHKFEDQVRVITEEMIKGLDHKTPNDKKLRYVTHVFAQTLDGVANFIRNQKPLN